MDYLFNQYKAARALANKPDLSELMAKRGVAYEIWLNILISFGVSGKTLDRLDKESEKGQYDAKAKFMAKETMTDAIETFKKAIPAMQKHKLLSAGVHYEIFKSVLCSAGCPYESTIEIVYTTYR